MIETKIWGTTRLVTENPAFELHEIVIKKGGYSSEHRHSTKWNGFYLITGRLIIRSWREGMVIEEYMGPGDYIQADPGMYHQFDAVEDCMALELYWSQYNRSDIERRTVGGVRET
jgi:quercetin dioxygenase-like cupin family protein